MVKCPTCGEQNRPGAVYCRNCGGRLINPELITKEEEKRIRATRDKLKKNSGIFGKIIQISIPATLLILTAYMILSPIKMPRQLNVSWRYAAKCKTKLTELRDYFNNAKKHRVGITEDELNSYLKKNFPAAQNAESIDLFLDDGLVLYISKQFFNRKITLRLYSGLLIENMQFKPEILQVRLGKLPIPSLLVNYIIDKYFLKKFSEDIVCPPFITGIEFSENIMYIKYDPEEKSDSAYTETEKRNVDQLLMQGNNLFKNKEYQSALEIYEKIIKHYPKDSRVPALKEWCDEINKKYINKL